MVRKYKCGSDVGHHVQTGEGTVLLQSLGHSPTDWGQRSECAEVLWRGVSS